jgi:HK97 family phage major capsid protein/HK97 family phage prohead protease
MSASEISMPEPQGFRPPRDDLVRAIQPGFELRDAEADGGMPTLAGHFARFGVWNEIDSMWEGRFMEQVAPGAYAKTIAENRDRMKVTFNHGRDPSLGDKVLGPIAELREDKTGPYYEVPLLDTSYNRDLIPGLEAGVYGASYRFRVMREELVEEPGISKHNPEGIPERTIKEAQVMEFGPVSYPADAGATAGVRSLTDEFMFDRLAVDRDRLRQLVTFVNDKDAQLAENPDAPSEPDAGDTHLEPERRDPEPEPEPAPIQAAEAAAQRKEEPMSDLDTQYPTREEKVGRITELKADHVRMAEENSGVLMPEDQARWDEDDAELESLIAAVDAYDNRNARVAQLSRDTLTHTETAVQRTGPTFQPEWTPEKIYDREAVYRDAKSPEDAAQRFRENALRAVEKATFPHERANQEDTRGDIEKLLLTADSSDAEIARRILVTGSPVYKRAFGKALKAGSLETLSHEERTVMAEGAGATGGFAITFELDPTIVKTSNGAVNPFRRVCRVVNISGTNEWRGVSSGAVVATYEAEATEAVDRSPTLAQPAFVTKRAQTFIPFSIELGQDWGALQAELAGLIQDSKDTLEATQFATGVGTTVFPQGIVTGATNTATTGTTTVLAVNDIYKTEEALPPRFRPNAQWFANRFIYNKVRQIDTAGGANLWVPDLRTGLANNETGNTGYNLIGYPANEASAMAATLATTTKLAVLGDPNYYVIVERVGLDIELIPHLFGLTANYPSGQRGIYAMWRNTGRVFDAAGFVTLVGA